MYKLLILLIVTATLSCKTKKEGLVENDLVELDENAPAEGFNIEESSFEAIVLADKVMQNMGGRKAWDETRYISWTFFGRRNLLWDKHSGDVRIEFIDSDQVIIVNINNLKGRAFNEGREITNEDSLANYMSKGKSIWINDSYWLVMPYKLKDTGVTLHFIGEDTTQDGRSAHFVQITFDNIGDTPENVYNIWVDVESGLVSQWAYFKTGEETKPNFVTPWSEYKKYGNILLSGNRGKYSLTNIKVLDEVPNTVFTDF